MAVIHTGSYNAASNNPTTAAPTPAIAARSGAIDRSRSQNGRMPATSRNDGRKMAMSANRPPVHPPTGPAITVPRYAENVNSGPGTACAAP